MKISRAQRELGVMCAAVTECEAEVATTAHEVRCEIETRSQSAIAEHEARLARAGGGDGEGL